MGFANVRKTISALLTTDLFQFTRDKEEDRLATLATLTDYVAAGFDSGNDITVGTATITSAVPTSLKVPTQVLTDDGAITIKYGLVILNKGSAIAATLADPTATTDDGKILSVTSITAQAHTVTIAGGINGGGSGADVGTFGAAIGNGFAVIAYGGKWYRYIPDTNVTWA